jgi:hypothetical protein
MKWRQTTPLFAIAALSICLTSCGGSGSTPPTPPATISVTLAAAPTSVATSATAMLTATVANDTKNAGVTWTVTCGSSACGSFSSPTTASSAATTYTAPAAVPTSNTVTVTATSVTDTTKSASATITITATAPGISVALTPTPPTSLAVGATTSLTAVVTNDTKNGGVTWTVSCGGGGSCGSFNPTSTASGTATTYTAPTTIPNSSTVTVTATSVTDTTKSASATITIGATPAILGDGTYVYNLSGEDSTGPYFVVGAFTVQGGAITAGEQDFTDFSSEASANALVPSGCSLTTAGGNIQIVLDTGNTSIGVGGIETLRGATVSSSRVLISEFDTFAVATGSVDLQTSAAAPSGGYAFALHGLDETTQQNILVIGGILNFSGGALTIGSSVYDFNDGGTVGQAQAFASGSVTAPDSFGRVTITLTPASTLYLAQIILSGYIVGTNQIQILENQPDALGADTGGVALGQGTNAGKFSQASVANTTYVHASSGADANGVLTIAGGFSFGSSGGLTGPLAVNDGTNAVVTAINGGAYTVDPTGRVTLSGVTLSSTLTGVAGPFAFQIYLDGNGNALELGVDNSEATAGPSYLQTATSSDFEGSYALAGQGFLPPSSNTAPAPLWGAAGPVTVASDAFTGSTDYNAQGYAATSAVSLTGTETSSTGLLSLTGLNGTNFATANSYSYFPIDSTRVLAIEIDGQMLGLLQLEGVSH